MANSQAPTNASADHSTGQFEMVRRTPSRSLAGVVTDLVGFRELVPAYVRQSEAASLTVPLVISFGEPFAIGLSRAPGDNDRYASFASGLHAGPVVIDSFGRSCCVQVNFTPLGARRFFGIPMHELADRMVTLDEVLGPDGNALRERLGQETGWHRRLDLVESYIVERLAITASPAAEIAWAMAKITSSGGRIRIAAIASEIGCSRKHLAARFADQVGIGPKAVARIVRFDRTARLARNADEIDWADLAVECGYADQAHLVREFRELSGTTPTALLQKLN
ncbi:AraC-like DNA-binding protein [Aminobacter niigataensis]|uniref:AraC-like DNA-binding protein n=1 Tax=Aminobacter niigataensis TaxID=83265 RepID=A0ABR6KYA8_9HYPH|nr:helix-turn-helix transcriptional regulator [Aminobacter niigataensis]MBB4648929.1 AraC-like DNA-binding protein [Aminobacter niigataensis]